MPFGRPFIAEEPVTAILLIAFFLLIAFPVHEFFHAYAADRLGDRTPRGYGRLTLNPIAHIDPVGTLLLPLLGIPFGWARPVPVNPTRFRRDVTMKTLGILFLIYTLLSALALRYLILPWIRSRITGAISSASAASPVSEDAAPFHGLVDKIVAQARAAGATVHVNGTSDASAADAAERLSALKAMLDQGLISRDDYEAKKAEMLSGL